MTENKTKHQKILDYIDLINRYPKKNVNYFFFDDETKSKFIVSGVKLTLLPIEYRKFLAKDEQNWKVYSYS